jgi:prevent-host-death family protein
MQTHSIHAAKTHLSRLVEEAAAGETIIIANNGKPIAKLVALEGAVKLPRIGFAKGVGTGPTLRL